MPRVEPNSYSQRWFDCFHTGIAEPRTTRETDFVCACAPLPCFRKVLDVCCGMGRHARALCSRGYAVTGVERDAGAIAMARRLAGGPSYIQEDIRNYQPETFAYDIAIVMSQSFGYFDAETNRNVLSRLAAGVRKGGRILLDLWSPEFFATHQGEREFKLAGGIVYERKRVGGDRLFVHLDYPGGGADDFEWQLFTRSQMASLAHSAGMVLIAACTDFDLTAEPCPTKPGIQFVLEQPSQAGPVTAAQRRAMTYFR